MSSAMLEPTKINSKEIPLVTEIVRNETWLLGERVGHAVDPKSAEVASKVVEIVLKSGSKWRTDLELGGDDDMRQ